MAVALVSTLKNETRDPWELGAEAARIWPAYKQFAEDGCCEFCVGRCCVFSPCCCPATRYAWIQVWDWCCPASFFFVRGDVFLSLSVGIELDGTSVGIFHLHSTLPLGLRRSYA